MKKSIFFIAAGALALSACTSSEVIEEGVQSNAIAFQNLVGKESRTVVDTENFGAFHVYGYYTKTIEGSANPTVVGVFNDDVVTKTDEGWNYENTRYWVPGAKYYFYAYSCGNQQTPTGVASFDLTGTSVSARALGLNNYVLHDHDLVYASNEGGDGAPGITGKNADNEAVALNFSHILSRVRVTFKSAFAPGYQIKVSNVKFVNVRNKGDFSPKPSFAWSNVERNPQNSTPEVDFVMSKDQDGKVLDVATAEVPAVGTEGEAGYVAAVSAVYARTDANYVIPFAYTEANVQLVFDIDVMDKDGNIVYEQTVTGTWKPEWKMSTAYNYNITISGVEAGLEKIEFAVGQIIAGWPSSSVVSPDGDGAINIGMEFQSTAKE